MQSDPFGEINTTFRTLYGANREELFASTPLAAITLIGTGEIWRIEHGEVVQSYPPAPWLRQVKSLMHAVIGAQATWARLVRGKDPESARQAAVVLNKALEEAVSRLALELPAALAAPAQIVLGKLLQLAVNWSAGQMASPAEFPEALRQVRVELENVIAIVGEEAYASIVKGLRALIDESDPAVWEESLFAVCGVAFGRRDNVEIAAAMSVMGEDCVGTRLLYLENAHDVAQGMACIAAALTDRALGVDVFGDPYRMWRDILGDVAARHVGKGFFPPLGPD
ncbi:MAG: hypothetical protein AB7F41_08120 [Methylocystis sp.]|uniref:hypothetical protein n=1 Tax=Methylocystis sp. TaxID=1911079 RepID=UPI003D131092